MTAPAVLLFAGFLADTPQDTRAAYPSGPLGLIIVLALCLVCFFLFRSMNRHLKRVPRRFDDQPGPEQDDDRDQDRGPRARRR
jgi:hypothetical protein